LQKEFDLTVRWTAFPLHPEIPEEGMTLEQLFAGRPIDWNEVKARLKKAARDAGLPFAERSMTYNSRLAQELGKWAETRGSGETYHRAVFRAYFARGINIGKREELIALAKEAGLPADEAGAVLERRDFKEAVDRDWARSHQLGFRAVTTFILGPHTLVGAQPYEKLTAWTGGIKTTEKVDAHRRSRDRRGGRLFRAKLAGRYSGETGHGHLYRPRSA
jgi:predicted DsbA family dithiol-disulfide isomerase